MFWQIFQTFGIVVLMVIAIMTAVRLMRIQNEHSELQSKTRGLLDRLDLLAEDNTRLRGEVAYFKAYLDGRDAAATPSAPSGGEPTGVPVSFKEALGRLGFSFSEDVDWWEYEHLPASIRLSFDTFEDEGKAYAKCIACMDPGLAVVESEARDLHPGQSLGIFCTDCGRGRLFPEVNKLRRLAGLPELPDGQLMQSIFVLQAEAKRLGIRQQAEVAAAAASSDPEHAALPSS